MDLQRAVDLRSDRGRPGHHEAGEAHDHLQARLAARRHLLHGRDLRYVLTIWLFTVGEQSVDELVAAVRGGGFDVEGRPSKAVSDALRWEVRRGRVRRVGRGRYARGRMPRSTYSWMRAKVRALHTTRARPVG